MHLYKFDRPKAARLSRLAAFAAHGVTLKYPGRSWSGVRADDGVVVLAIRAEDVLTDACGCRCLLWAPPHRGALDRASADERLAHCRLAILHGGAEGLLAHGDAAEVDSNLILALRVVRRHEEYWAAWGSPASALAPSVPWSLRRPADLFAA